MNRLPQEITSWCDELAQTEIYQERIRRHLDPCFPVTSPDILRRFPSFEDFCKRAEAEIEQENRRKSKKSENKSLDETILIEDEPVENRIEKHENMEVDEIITKTGAKDLNQNEVHEKSSEPEKIRKNNFLFSIKLCHSIPNDQQFDIFSLEAHLSSKAPTLQNNMESYAFLMFWVGSLLFKVKKVF